MTAYSAPVFDTAVNRVGMTADHLSIALDQQTSEPVTAHAKADDISHRTATLAIGGEKVRAARNTRGLVA